MERSVFLLVRNREVLNNIYELTELSLILFRDIMFFTAQGNKELAEVLSAKKTAGPMREYNALLESLKSSISLYLYTNVPPDFETEPKSTLSFNRLLDWAKMDWKQSGVFKKFDENVLVVFIARGGMILLDDIENEIDNHIWTFIKPKVITHSHESSEIYEEYTDEHLNDKLQELSHEIPVNILFIEDIVEEDEYESNIVAAMELLADKLVEFDFEIGNTACVALLSRTSHITNIPVYGIVLSYSGGIETDWGNDNPEGADYRDFSEQKENIEDHDA